jgi:hypothetical protein
MDMYQKALSVLFTLDKWQKPFFSITTGSRLLTTISIQLLLRKLGLLLLERLDSTYTPVKESLATASLTLLQERFPSIATGRAVLAITFLQPVLQKVEQQLLDKWDGMDIPMRVWHAMSFPTMDEYINSSIHTSEIHRVAV